MSAQIALPLAPQTGRPAQIVIGNGNAHVAEALSQPANWPFGTAILTGPARSGKSLLAHWFASTGQGEVIDDAHGLDETVLFHRWNRAQEQGRALLIVAGTPPWSIILPDLRSRMGAAMQLEIGQPDDAMAHNLILAMAAERGLPLAVEGADYLVARAGRSQAELERLVLTIDRISLERKAAPTLGIWRAALEEVLGPDEPRLL